MIRFKNHGSFFVDASLSRGQGTRLVFLYLIFSSLCLPVNSLISHCCYDEEEGHRLNTTVFKFVKVSTEYECAEKCAYEMPCCRSANFLNMDFNDGRKNCELLHTLSIDEPENLEINITYDYLIVPIAQHRPFNCSCGACKNNGSCHKSSNKCTCPVGITGERCEKAKNCKELKQTGITQSGVYLIDPDGLGSFNVSCDMTIDGGGWTVFQRRMDGSVDFYLGWDKYKNGFGNMSGEFWLGLDKIHRLTKNKETELRVDLEDFDGGNRFANYKIFKVDAENQNYTLHVGNFTGDAGDSLAFHNGMKFSMKR